MTSSKGEPLSSGEKQLLQEKLVPLVAGFHQNKTNLLINFDKTRKVFEQQNIEPEVAFLVRLNFLTKDFERLEPSNVGFVLLASSPQG